MAQRSQTSPCVALPRRSERRKAYQCQRDGRDRPAMHSAWLKVPIGSVGFCAEPHGYFAQVPRRRRASRRPLPPQLTPLHTQGVLKRCHPGRRRRTTASGIHRRVTARLPACGAHWLCSSPLSTRCLWVRPWLRFPELRSPERTQYARRRPIRSRVPWRA